MGENYYMREKNKADNPSSKSFMDYVRSINPVYYYLLFSLFAVVLLVHMFTGQWINTPNTYNSFALQAKSWLEGRLDLGENYSYLEIAEYNGKYFISFPPFVSYVLLPFAIIFGERTPDNLIAVICYLVAAVYAVKLFRKIRDSVQLTDGYGSLHRTLLSHFHLCQSTMQPAESLVFHFLSLPVQ